ncbi:MAG: transposase [Candidatus Binataceae bacterium]|nr:transposase [Candidatus Binataceae bacterium]
MPGVGGLHQRLLWVAYKAALGASARIHAIHERSRATYGAPRIHAELPDQGIRVGCKRVARLLEACPAIATVLARIDLNGRF